MLIREGAIVSRKVVSVGPGRTVMAVAATDPAQVERLLRPSYGRHVRVWQSRWSQQTFWQATDELNSNFERWDLMTVGDQLGPEGQSVVVASTVRLLPEMITWLAAYQPGMVELRPGTNPRWHECCGAAAPQVAGTSSTASTGRWSVARSTPDRSTTE